MNELEKFLEERSKIPIPSGDVPRVKLLAKELAMGVDRGLWQTFIRALGHDEVTQLRSGFGRNIQPFFEKRWSDSTFGQHIERLKGRRYLLGEKGSYEIAPSAFHLLDETEPHNIFISYRRLDSSALALLVLARLKEHSLVPFVDMALQAGGNWHADLEARIKACDYFIILLGKDTLSSPMTVKEVQWALEFERAIIPIWHSGFAIGISNGKMCQPKHWMPSNRPTPSSCRTNRPAATTLPSSSCSTASASRHSLVHQRSSYRHLVNLARMHYDALLRPALRAGEGDGK